MWIRSFKCSLVVVLFACVFFAGSGNVSAGERNANTAALSNTGELQDAENIPGVHDRHKGIRSYDSTGFPHDNNANRGIKSYGTPSGHGASYDHGIKGGGHGYNKNGDACSKCKWENDEYWERDEPEEEGDENDGDECDDGQYKPHKEHHHGPGGHKPGSRPSGVYKTGPTGIYGVDDEIKKDGSPGPLGGINYPTGTGYTRPISSYETTPKPGSGWNTPLADASKPGYDGVTASTFRTTPSSWPDWNRGTGTSPSSSVSTSNPSWSGGHDGRFPSSQEPDASTPNFGTTSKPGQGWNNQFPSGSSSAVPHIGSGVSSPSSYGNPQQSQKPYGQPGTQNTYAGAYAGTSVTSGIAGSYGEPTNFGRKDHPFGLYKPVNTQTPHGGVAQAPSNTDTGLGDYNKPASASHSIQPITITNTFGTTKGPYGGIDSSKIPGVHENPFAPERSPGSPSGSGIYEHPGVTKPSFSGSTTSWSGAGSGSSTWHRTTPHAGFPTVNTGFGTTKPPLSHVSVPNPTLSTPYDRTKPSQPGFNVASSSATASASAFGTSPDTYGTPTGTSFYGTTPAHRESPNYTPGIKGSIGSTRPAYGSIPHGTQPNIESNTWSGGQPVSGPWSSGKPEGGSGITPDRHSPGGSGILLGNQPQGGTWSTGQPASGSGAWPSKQPGDGTWPSQIQPGRGSGPGCPSGNCGGATGPQESNNCGGCCGNYNCDGGCSGRGNVPETHGCGAAVGPSVNKTYYPAGTGDGNVPNLGYRPDSHFNPGVYPGIQGVTPESHVPWNSANPFLYQTGGSTPSSVSHPWTETTDKPIGQGNPFLDSNWNNPKPEHGNNDRNVIPLGGENTKPIGQGNPFLDESNRRGGANANPNEGVIPLEEKIPKGNNPFLRPLAGGNSNLGNPSYDKQPDRSGTPGNFPGSGTPGNYPGSGTPGSFPGSGTPGSFPGSRTPGNYPGSGTPINYPGAGTPGNFPGSGTSGHFPGSGTPGNYPGSETPGSYPGSGSGGYGGVKGGIHSGGGPPQDGNSDRSSPTGNNSQSPGPLECKLGLFGCGTSGSGSYAGKHPGEAFGGIGGNVGSGIANPGNIGGPSRNPGIGFVSGAGHPGSGGSNLAASVSGAQAGAYAGSVSSAQASSSSFAGSFSGASGPANNFGGNLSPNGAQNQGGPNSWASSSASAFASSNAGSWSGNRPIDVKG